MYMDNPGRKIFILTVIFCGLILLSTGDLLAQCAMCKASVESNVSEDGIGFAAKLNIGILYLFATPYILAIVIGYFWYRKSQAHKRELEKAEYRKHRIAKL